MPWPEPGCALVTGPIQLPIVVFYLYIRKCILEGNRRKWQIGRRDIRKVIVKIRTPTLMQVKILGW